MNSATFDALAYFENLKAAGVPEEQAKVQANAFRDFSLMQEEKARNELATKMDVLQAEMRLAGKIEEAKHETLKWVIGLLLAQSAGLVAIFSFLR